MSGDHPPVEPRAQFVYHHWMESTGCPIHTPPLQLHDYSDKAVNANDHIQYTAEDPAIRAMFERELAARGLTSLMSDELYAAAPTKKEVRA